MAGVYRNSGSYLIQNEGSPVKWFFKQPLSFAKMVPAFEINGIDVARCTQGGR